jgi:hypothetical protein
MSGGIIAKASLQRCITDEGVFVPTPITTLPPSSELAIGSWVNDLIGIAPTNEGLDKIEARIEKYVELEKRGKPKKVLGMEVNWASDHEIVLTQTGLIENLALAHGITGIKHSLPIEPTYYEPDCTSPANQKELAIVSSLL